MTGLNVSIQWKVWKTHILRQDILHVIEQDKGKLEDMYELESWDWCIFGDKMMVEDNIPIIYPPPSTEVELKQQIPPSPRAGGRCGLSPPSHPQQPVIEWGQAGAQYMSKMFIIILTVSCIHICHITCLKWSWKQCMAPSTSQVEASTFQSLVANNVEVAKRSKAWLTLSSLFLNLHSLMSILKVTSKWEILALAWHYQTEF